MKIVIQCAGKRRSSAGSLVSDCDKRVMFVASPQLAPPNSELIYAHPDDVSGDGRTWRERLLDYNARNSQDNPLNLLPAYMLYTNIAYAALVHKFGDENIYILSAGWGLIRADFLTPTYDITFSSTKNKHIKRSQKMAFADFNMLKDDGDDIVFIGGKSYQPMFCQLLKGYDCRKSIIYNSIAPPDLPHGFEAVLYETSTRTNWHYKFATELAEDVVEF